MAKAKSAGASASTANAYTEFGATGLKQYSGYVREEWDRPLIGRRGLLILREMRDNDPVIGAIFFAFEMLLRGVDFHVEAGDSKSQNAADFIESCIGDMEVGWSSLLVEILSFLLYGWDVHEIVYKIRKGVSDDPKFNSKYDDGMIGWRKFASRGQETLLHWIFDDAGDATHLVQLLPTGGPLLQVPLAKCLHFRTTPYKANPEGRSVLRNAYQSYYLKKYIQEIEAIGVTRDLTGLTVVRVPAKWTLQGATAADKASLAAAKVIARDTSRNQQEGLVIPVIRDKNGEYDFDVELLASGGRRQFPTNDIIQRYNEAIAMTVLADFITLGGGASAGRGSNAQAKSKVDIFSVAVIAFLDLITDEINRKAIPDLLRLNGIKDVDVQVVHGDIQRRNLADLGTYLLDAFQSGLLTPDAALEAYVREEGGLPAPDQDTMRDLGDGGAGGNSDKKSGADQDEEDEEDETANDPAARKPAPRQAQGAAAPKTQGAAKRLGKRFVKKRGRRLR